MIGLQKGEEKKTREKIRNIGITSDTIRHVCIFSSRGVCRYILRIYIHADPVGFNSADGMEVDGVLENSPTVLSVAEQDLSERFREVRRIEFPFLNGERIRRHYHFQDQVGSTACLYFPSRVR